MKVAEVLDALARLAGGGMKEALRLLSYARRYWAHLVGSVVLMAMAGAAQAMLLLLIKPVFDRVLDPHAREQTGRMPLLTHPILRTSVLPGPVHAASASAPPGRWWPWPSWPSS